MAICQYIFKRFFKNEARKISIYLSMGKNRVLLRLSKWLLVLILLILIISQQQKNVKNEQSFWSIGTTLVKEYVIKQILYSQSVVWGLLEELDHGLWVKKPQPVVESFLEFELTNQFLAVEEELKNKVLEENGIIPTENKEEFLLSDTSSFSPVIQKQVQFEIDKYKDFTTLMKQFYIADPTAGVKEELFDIHTLHSYDCTVNKEAGGPQILLYHTHASEAFADSRQGVEEDTIVGAGEILASYLESYGFQVLHHKEVYDEKRDYAYSYALPEVEQILKENPTIEVVLDLHRDAVAEGTKLVTDIQGKQMAKVMFFNGLSRSATSGDIGYLANPYLQENLAFSFQMKLACDEYYPGFARSIYLRAYRYNMHLCPKTLLIELGAQTNTVEEIQNSLAPLAHTLSMVLGKK